MKAVSPSESVKSSGLVLLGFSFYAISILISQAFMSVGAGFLALCLVVARKHQLLDDLRSESKRSASRVYLWASLLLIATCALSLVVAAVHPLVIAGNHAQIHFFRDMGKVWYLLWPLVLVAGLRPLPGSGRFAILRTWIIAFWVVGMVGIVQYYTGWPRSQQIPGNPGRYHAILFFGHHLSTASILIFPFFAVLDALAKKDWPERLGLPRWFLVLAAAVGGLTLFLTYSRTLWVALPLGILVWLLWSLPKKWGWVSAGLFAAGTAILSFNAEVSRRLHDMMGVATRVDLWKSNLEFLKLRPLTGTGWHHNSDYSGWYLMAQSGASSVFTGHAHNDFLDMLGGTGALGALAWLAWTFVAFWLLFRAKKDSLYRGMICAWLVFEINGLTQVNIWEGKVEHQMAWVLAWSLLWVA